MGSGAGLGIVDLSVTEARDRLERGDLSAVELTEATLARIEATEPLVHAYAHVSAEAALARAHEADAQQAKGEPLGLLHGIPIGVKDLCFTADAPTEGGSRVLAGQMPNRDAVVVKKLRDASAVIIGKTVTHEIAYSQNVVETRNAWNLDFHSGGSSAGSGVAVAARSCFAAIGTDTGGSIREPAAFNGVVGLKPTNSRVSREGVIPLAPSLDTVGPLTRTVEDCALMLRAIAGCDAGDPTAWDEPVLDYSAGLTGELSGLTIGVDRSYFFYDPVTTDVREAVDAGIEELQRLGAKIVQVEIPQLELATTVGMTVLLSEASAYHGHWLRARGVDYVRETRMMLQLGEMLLATDYIRAQRARRVLRDAMQATFTQHSLDALVGPTAPTAAVPLDSFSVDLIRSVDDPDDSHELYARHVLFANVTGQPALSVPCGYAGDGLPIGLQLIGRPFDEATLLRIGDAHQRVSDAPLRRPPLA